MLNLLIGVILVDAVTLFFHYGGVERINPTRRVGRNVSVEQDWSVSCGLVVVEVNFIAVGALNWRPRNGTVTGEVNT